VARLAERGLIANKDGHRRFGSIRKRASGRYQVRYPGPDGLLRTAPQTFERLKEAERWLTLAEAQMMRGEWIDPDRGKIKFQDYAHRWVEERPNLRPRTRGLYRQLLRTNITPQLGQTELGTITTETVRAWRARLLADGVTPGVAAKSYRLLRAILNAAVKEDELIRANPCRIPGADREHAEERPVLAVAQVYQLADSVPARFRAMILLTTFGCLRWGEVTGVQRQDLDLKTGTVWVRRAMGEDERGALSRGPVKSRAGVRRVSLPAAATLPEIRDHLREHVAAELDALVFTGPSKAHPPLRRNNFRKLVRWQKAVTALGVTDLHFHDLRHTGNTLAEVGGVASDATAMAIRRSA
jgi:integrase